MLPDLQHINMVEHTLENSIAFDLRPTRTMSILGNLSFNHNETG